MIRKNISYIFYISLFMISTAIGTSQAATITVNSLNDTAADDGLCTLREAITSANSNAVSGATVGECAAGDDSDDAIDLTGLAGNIATTTLPDITADLTINGPGAGTLTITGDASARVLRVDSGGTGAIANINGITITGGKGGLNVDPSDTLNVTSVIITANNRDNGDGGGIRNQGGTLTVTNSTLSMNVTSQDGGAIITQRVSTSIGTTTITGSTLSGNTSTQEGGAIMNENGCSTTITNSTITGNTSNSGGGGIYNIGGCLAANCGVDTPSTVNIFNSTISNNTASGNGGGIRNDGGSNSLGTTLNVTNSTISGNHSDTGGGGILSGKNAAVVTITNSTISGNSTTGYGGGILNGNKTDNIFTIINSTITNNTSDSEMNGSGAGGGIRVDDGTNNFVTLTNTIVAGNIDNTGASPDCSIASVGEMLLASVGNNLIGDVTGCTDHTLSVAKNDQIGDAGGAGVINPLLGALTDANGGDPASGVPTAVHYPQSGSTAIGGADNSIAIPPATDQLGFARSTSASDHTDIGAVQTGCGNNQVDAGEDCDEGGETATCDANCSAVACGDGDVNVTAGEECDDGNIDDGDGCSSMCKNEAVGDGTGGGGESSGGCSLTMASTQSPSLEFLMLFGGFFLVIMGIRRRQN